MRTILFFIFFYMLSPLFSMQKIIEPSMEKRELSTLTVDNSGYDMKFIWLDLELSNQNAFIKGKVTMQAMATRNLEHFFLELSDNLTVDSILLNGSKVVYLHEEDTLHVEAGKKIMTGELFETTTWYSGSGGKGSFFAGISNRTDGAWNAKVTYTLSEPYSAKEWFPVKQSLPDKIDSVHVFATVDDSLKVGSNGLLTATVPVDENKVRYEWKSNYPIAYYLISVAVANYQEYTIYAHPAGSDGDSLPVVNYIYNRPGILEKNKKDIDETVMLIEYFSRVFGTYPFMDEKYGHCLAPMGGGMEHQTMTTLSNFGFTLVAHELAHMWFGNNVTCENWQDIWVNEGFATYGEYLALAELVSEEEAANWLEDAHQYSFYAGKGSIHVPEDELDNESRIFNYSLSYKKGASILHMMRHLAGEEAFFNTLKEFQVVFADSVATAEDFKYILEENAGKDFDQFFEQWYYGESYPVFNIAWKQDGDSLIVTSYQYTNSEKTPLFITPVDLQVSFREGGDTLFTFLQDKNTNQFVFPVTGKVELMRVDPDNWLLNKSTVVQIESSALMDVYPNPGSTKLTLEFPDYTELEQVVISNLQGKTFIDTTASGRYIELNIRHLLPGIYIVNVVTGNDKTYNARFLKL